MLSKGLIFDIQRFSVHDGPGIRTTVFFKGCNLRCLWCHNPESLNACREIEIYPDKCIHCGKCASACLNGALRISNGVLEYDRQACARCGRCTKQCYAGARVITGKWMTASDVLEVVGLDKAFYERSGGGVTFSGGEPLLQKDFLLELLAECRTRGLNTAVDTAGNVPFEHLEQAAALADLVLYDLKAMNDETHRRVTGVGNGRILGNLAKLADGRVDIIIRIPVIPSVNDDLENMRRTAAFLKPLAGIRLVELLPFHKLGEAKYLSLGLEYGAKDFPQLQKGKTTALSHIFLEAGINVLAY